MPVGHGEFSLTAPAELVPGLQPAGLGMVEKEMVRLLDRVRPKIFRIRRVVPSDDVEPDNVAARHPTLALRSPTPSVLTMPGFAAAGLWNLIAGGVDLATFHDGAVLVETHAPTHGVAAQ